MKTPKLSLLAAAAVLVTSVNSIASAPMCAEVFSTQDIRFTKMDAQVTDKQVAVFKQVVADVNGSLGNTHLVIPDGVEIKVYTQHPDPVANPIDMSVNAGVRFFMGLQADKNNPKSVKNYYKVPTVSSPILAHEYGHIIFFENFGIREPIWREAFKTFREKMPELTVKDQQYQKLIGEIALRQEQLKTMTDKAQIAQIQQEMLQLVLQAVKLNKEIELEGAAVQTLSAITTSYNEFFADVMAVLYTGKPTSIEDAVTFTRTLQFDGKLAKEMKQSNDERNFKDRAEPRDAKDDFEDHGYFSTVRAGVWESYLASPTIRTAKRGQVTEAIFDAIAKECSTLIRSGAPVNLKTKEKWIELNERLMKAIDNEMAARGITKLK